MDDFLPGIDEYLNELPSKKVSSKGLEEVIARVRAKTGLSSRICDFIVSSFFQEIRTNMLKGNIIALQKLGNLFITSPLLGTTSEMIFAKFKPSATLTKKMNDT